jgi:signal transduction histidine kinase
MPSRLPIVVSALFVLLFLSPPVSAQRVSLLDEQWKFQLGDNPNWASPSFDDTKWANIQVPSILQQQHGKETKGWYRVHFDADIIKGSSQALFIEYIRHADETWLNGKKIGGKGHFEQPWQFTYTNPQGLARLYPIPKNLLKNKNNVLAIKTSIGFGSAWGAMFPGGAGIIDGDVYYDDLERLRNKYQQSVILTSTIDTLFLTLSFIDLFIIFFLLRFTLTNTREFKWLIVTSLFMFIGATGHDLLYLSNLDIHLNLLLFIALVGTPISMAMYFWAQYRNISKRFITIIAVVWLLTVITLLAPIFPDHIKSTAWYVLSVLITCFFIYSFFCAYQGIVLKRPGAIAQLVALIFYLLLIRTQWLPDTFLGHRNIQLGSLIYRYALLFAYFQQISTTQIHYKKLLQKVVQVVEKVQHTIARDLHDGMGQHLASIKLQSQLAKREQKQEYLNNIASDVDTSMQELRRIVKGLAPIQIRNKSISDAINDESMRIESAYQVIISTDIEPIDLSPDKAMHVFRIFQEVVRNSIQHGKATNIEISLRLDKNNLHLSVTDNGKGFDTRKKVDNDEHGFGLISLSERAAILDAYMNIESIQGNGTWFYIKIPLTNE